MRLVTDMIEWCSEQMPRWHPVSISGYHIREAGSTAQQPLNNVVRTSLEALAAVLGGTQSLHTNSFDEALALPTEEAVRVALRTQQIIAFESGTPNTPDPLGGSWFVEKLTDEMEQAAYGYFARIDELGGMVEAIRRNFPQREIADAAFTYQREVDERKRIVVGVNDFVQEGEEPTPILRIDPALERKQVERLAATRAKRDGAEAENALAELKRAAATEENLMPPIIAAARARATEGEMIAAMQEVFGTYTESPVF
jgi:methylmalonyl-CoA mutase N-terminal domain/subunit